MSPDAGGLHGALLQEMQVPGRSPAGRGQVQYSLGSSTVVTLRSASVITQTLMAGVIW